MMPKVLKVIRSQTDNEITTSKCPITAIRIIHVQSKRSEIRSLHFSTYFSPAYLLNFVVELETEKYTYETLADHPLNFIWELKWTRVGSLVETAIPGFRDFTSIINPTNSGIKKQKILSRKYKRKPREKKNFWTLLFEQHQDDSKNWCQLNLVNPF